MRVLILLWTGPVCSIGGTEMSVASFLSAPDKKALASIRRLSCLGLGSQIAVPAILGELHALIPSYSNQFFWAGPNQELVNLYDEGDLLLPFIPLYLEEFHNKREREVVFTFAETMRRSRRSEVMRYREKTLKVDERQFEKHDFYNLAMRPTGLHDALQLTVVEHGHSIGLLHISRASRDPEFTQRERQLLQAIAPFLAHAQAERPTDERMAESLDRGLIIASPAGVVEYLSPQAGRLLVMAQHPVLLSPGVTLPGPGAILPPEIMRLGDDLVCIFEGKAPSAVPVYQLRNAWGVFTFRAFWLDRTAQEHAAPLIGIVVERLEPLALKFWRRAENLPLSGREIEVCLPLALGRSRAEIADRIGVSENTAINHCRNIYAKLGVQSRAELVEKLHTRESGSRKRELVDSRERASQAQSFLGG
jgi:DNA-binding CsgD family transcriptional regulator